MRESATINMRNKQSILNVVKDRQTRRAMVAVLCTAHSTKQSIIFDWIDLDAQVNLDKSFLSNATRNVALLFFICTSQRFMCDYTSFV